MLLLLWVGAFTLPLAYVACRSALDSLVEEAVHAVADLVQAGASPLLLYACLPILRSGCCQCRWSGAKYAMFMGMPQRQ